MLYSKLPLGDLASPSPSRDFWEVASNRLELGKKLGEGAFGYVFKADLTIGEDSLQTKKVVAVKIPKGLICLLPSKEQIISFIVLLFSNEIGLLAS